MADDPNAVFRCACIGYGRNLDAYFTRCTERPTQEDALCEWCRRVCAAEPGWRTVPVTTPCRAVEVLF